MKAAFFILLLCGAAFAQWEDVETSWQEATSDMENFELDNAYEDNDFLAADDVEYFDADATTDMSEFQNVEFEAENLEATTDMESLELDNTEVLEHFLEEEPVELVKCLPGFYSQTNSTNNKTRCVRCPQGCARCNDGQTCQQCRGGHQLVNGKCQRQTGPKQNVTWPNRNNTRNNSRNNSRNSGVPKLEETEFELFNDEPVELLKCLPGFFRTNNATKCERCSRGCISCSTKETCVKCLKTFTLQDGKCTGGLLNIGLSNRPNITWPHKNNTRNASAPSLEEDIEETSFWEDFEASLI